MTKCPGVFSVVFEAGHRYVTLASLELSMETRLAQTDRDPPASVSHVLGLKASQTWFRHVTFLNTPFFQGHRSQCEQSRGPT